MKDIFQKGMFLWLDLHHTKTVQNWEMQSFDIVNLQKSAIVRQNSESNSLRYCRI